MGIKYGDFSLESLGSNHWQARDSQAVEAATQPAFDVESLESRYAMAWTFMLQGDPQNQQAYRVLHDHTLAITATNSVLVNDMAFDSSQGYRYGSQLGAVLASGPSHASSFQFNSNGTFTYTAAAGFTGTDIFTYRATYTDQNNVTWTSTSTANAVITVYNTDPTGYGDQYTAWMGGVLTVDAAHGVLQNEGTADPNGGPSDRVDYDGDHLSVSLASGDIIGPTHGSLQLFADGSFEYHADMDSEVNDSFQYRVTDGVGKSQFVNVVVTKASVKLIFHDQVQNASNPNQWDTVNKVLAQSGKTGGAGVQSLKVGEQADLELVLVGSTATGIFPFWTITGFAGTPTDTAIRGFAVADDPNTATVKAQETGRKLLLTDYGWSKDIYWISPGTKTVSITFTPAGGPPAIAGTFTITKPSDTITDTTVNRNSPWVTGTGNLVTGEAAPVGAPRAEDLVTFERGGGKTGNGGTYQWVQIINSSTVTYTYSNGFAPGTNGNPPNETITAPTLDAKYPYDLTGNAGNNPNGDGNYAMWDTPQSGLLQFNAAGNVVGYRNVVRSTSFTAYLQWKSDRPNSIYAPTRKMDWSVAYSATLTAAGWAIGVPAGSINGSALVSETESNCNDLPQWDDVR